MMSAFSEIEIFLWPMESIRLKLIFKLILQPTLFQMLVSDL